MNIIKAVQDTVLNGGMTRTTKDVDAVGGYAVAVKGYELISNLERLAVDMAQWLASNVEELEKPNRHVGTWVDGDNIYIDMSEVYTEKSEAVEVGKERKELAIFSLDTFEEIRL